MKKLQVKVILKDEKEKKASQGHNVFYFESKKKIGEFMASLGDGFSFYTGGVLKKGGLILHDSCEVESVVIKVIG